MAVLLHNVGRARKRHNIFESVFFILVVLVAAYVILQSPLFDVRQVIIKGNTYLAEEEIRNAVAISTGVNIFKINLAVVTEQLKMVPMIKDVYVSRDLPSTVLVNVTERRPLGIMQVGDGFVEVDVAGMCLQRASSGVPDIPVITGISVDAANPGDYIYSDLLADVLKVIDGLPEEIVSSLAEVHIDTDGQVKAYTIENIQCRLGSAVEIQEKGLILTRILREIRAQNAIVEYINITSVDKPAVKYK